MHLYAHNRIKFDFEARWKRIKRKPIFINREADPAKLYFTVLRKKVDLASNNIKDMEKLNTKLEKMQ